jgi:hypothetical protein
MINLNLAGILHSNPRGLHVQHFEQGIVILVEKDGSPGCRPQLHGTSHVINVSVGDDYLLDLEIVFLDQIENVFDVIAGINHHPFTGGFVPNN